MFNTCSTDVAAKNKLFCRDIIGFIYFIYHEENYKNKNSQLKALKPPFHQNPLLSWLRLSQVLFLLSDSLLSFLKRQRQRKETQSFRGRK